MRYYPAIKSGNYDVLVSNTAEYQGRRLTENQWNTALFVCHTWVCENKNIVTQKESMHTDTAGAVRVVFFIL